MKYFIALVLTLGLIQTSLAATPKKGSTFFYNLGQGPTTLNPLSSTDLYATMVQQQIVESLLERDLETFEWKPALAKEWEVSKDGMEYTFTLRDGVKWHDGKPLTVEDVKFTFDAIVHPENKYKTAHMKPFYENIKSCEIIGKNKVKFTAKKKYFQNFAVAAGIEVVPKHLYENPSKKQKKKLNKTLVGTGPYMLDKYKRGKNLVLKKNPNWWGDASGERKAENNFNKIFMRFIKDGTIAITRAEKGDLDYIDLTSEEFVKKTNSGKWGKEIFKFKVQNKAPVSYGFIGWNLTNPIFKSKQVRKALYHLVNRDLMIEKFRYGLSLPATGPLYRQSEYADPTVKPIGFDPKKALDMLMADGWKVGSDKILEKKINGQMTKLSFTILEPNKEFMKYLTVFKEDAKKAGVDVRLKFVEWSTFIKLLDERKFEAVRLGWGGGSVDWDPKQIWHSASIKGGSNFIGYNNPKVDKLIDEARVLMDKKARKEKLREVFRIIADDVPYVFFFNDKYKFYANRKRIKKNKDTLEYGIGRAYWWIEK